MVHSIILNTNTYLEGCVRPSLWCTHSGSKYLLQDCDGDGILDPTCSGTSGQFGVLQSVNSCTDTWPNGKCQAGNSSG